MPPSPLWRPQTARANLESDSKWFVCIQSLIEWRAVPCHSRESGNPCWRLDSRFRGSDIVVPVTRDFQFQIKHLFRAGHL